MKVQVIKAFYKLSHQKTFYPNDVLDFGKDNERLIKEGLCKKVVGSKK